MKSKKTILSVVISSAIVALIVIRIVSNKRSFGEQLNMITEFNTAVPVFTDTVKYKQNATEFSVNGTFNPIQDISITSEIQGKIISIAAQTGDNVKSGQILASIDNTLYKSQFDLAKSNLDKAEKDKQRFEVLSKSDAVTMQQYEMSKLAYENAQSAYISAKMQYSNTYIKAPFDGIIIKKHIEKGAYLSPGTPVFDIVVISKVKFIAKLTVDEVENVQKGQTIKITIDNCPGLYYDGIVTAIVVQSDLSKRYDVEVEVNNNSGKLIKPGMYGTATFGNNKGERSLIIPRIALVGSIKEPEVYKVQGDSVISQRIDAITLDDNEVSVTKGLKAGDVIVVSGQINLVNGSKVKLLK